MKLRIDFPEINHETFERIWMEYTLTRLSNLRFSCYRDIQTSKFSDGVLVAETKYYRLQYVLAFSLCRLQEKAGYNNQKIRNLKSFREKYLKSVKEIWSEYYDGIRSCDTPYSGERSFKKFDYFWFIQNNKYLRICQSFFIQWSGKDVSQLVKERYKPISSHIKNRDFDAFFHTLKSIEDFDKRLQFSLVLAKDMSRVFKVSKK
jgi:hypothetical protein